MERSKIERNTAERNGTETDKTEIKINKAEADGEEISRRKRRMWIAAFFLLLSLQVLTLLYFGNKKEGFHEDEYYSYYSTNRTAGLYEPEGEWVERDTIYKEFVVCRGEAFRYGLVAQVQSWDVHPPFYYFLLHTACSLFPEVFSKWLGLGVNILAFCINFVLLTWLAYMVTDKNRRAAFAVAAVYGFNAVIISGVMFIRMYEWLTVFVLLCACLHVRAVKKNRMDFKTFLLPLMAVTYLGFLTQYYYIIFLFFMAAGFCLWRLYRDRRIGNCVKYGISSAAALALAVLSYPASLSHIFRGYRGTGAASEFFNAANTGERLRFFAGLMNDYLFDGLLGLWLLALGILAAAVLFRKWKEHAGQGGRNRPTGSTGQNEPTGRNRPAGQNEPTGRNRPAWLTESRASWLLLLLAVCGYFFTVSKTALLLQETSNRYQLPIYGIVLLLVITALYGLGREAAKLFGGDGISGNIRLKRTGMAVLLLLFFLGDMHGLASGRVLFLYEGEAARTAYARENAHEPVVILYNNATPYHVWWCAQELMQYDRVYFTSGGRIRDGVTGTCDKLIVYAADGDNKEESLEQILECNPKLKGYRLISQKPMWSVYEFE